MQGHYIIFHFGVQSHHRRFSVLAFKAIIITFSTWRSESHFQFRHSEPSSSHFWFRHSKPSLSLLSFGVQSHHHHIFNLTFRVAFLVSALWAIIIAFLVLAFKAIIVASQFRRSEPSSHFQFDVESHIFSFGVQSHHHRIFSFSVQSHYLFAVSGVQGVVILTFGRLEPSFSAVWHLEPPYLLSLGLQSHHSFPVWHLEPSSYHDQVFVTTFSAFRAIFRCLESSSTLRRSKPSFTFRRLESSFIFRRSDPLFTFRHSKPSFTFRCLESSSTSRRSEPHY